MGTATLIRIIRGLVCSALVLAISLAPLQAANFGAGAHAAIQTVACESVQHCCEEAKLACAPMSACFASSSLAMLAEQDVEYRPLLPESLDPLRHAVPEGLSPSPLRRPPRA